MSDQREAERNQPPAETPDVAHIRNPDVAREAQDVDARGVLQFLFWLAVIVVVSLGLMWALLKGLQLIRSEPAGEVSRLPRRVDRLPPSPRFVVGMGRRLTPEDFTHDPLLQRELSASELDFELGDPNREWELYRRVKQRELESYGVNAGTGEYRIPIEAAKRLVLERHLLAVQPPPTRTGATGAGSPPDDGQRVLATPASSGRRLERLKR